MSRVETPVNILFNDLSLPFSTLNLRPADAVGGVLPVEFVVEILGKHQIVPQIFEPPFERALENFGLGKPAGFRDCSNPVGDFSGYAVWLFGIGHKSASVVQSWPRHS